MNVFAKFDEIPPKTLQDIKETKRHGHTFVRTDGQTDNVKTVYPPTNTVCGEYNKWPNGQRSFTCPQNILNSFQVREQCLSGPSNSSFSSPIVPEIKTLQACINACSRYLQVSK